MAVRMFDKLKLFFLSLIPIGYYDGNMQKLRISKNKVKLELSNKDFTPWLLICARGYYREYVRRYPVTSKRELSKLISLDSDFKPETQVYFKCLRVLDGASLVNIWQFLPTLPKANIMLPESLVFAFGSDFVQKHGVIKNFVLSVLRDEGLPRLFIANSSMGVQSSQPSAVISSAELFGQAVGLTTDIQTAELTLNHQALSLKEGLLKIPSNWLMSFISFSPDKLILTRLKRPIYILILTLIIYILGSSLWLLWQEKQLEVELSKNQTLVERALQLQDNTNRLLGNIASLNRVTIEMQTITRVWEVILPVSDISSLSTFRYQDGRFIIVGEAARATDVLSVISAFQGVRDAHFDLPVSKQRNKEQFTISFRWSQLD